MRWPLAALLAIGLAGLGYRTFRQPRARTESSPRLRFWVESPPVGLAQRTEGKLRVLFIGNSFTCHFDGVPALVGSMARSRDDRPEPCMGMIGQPFQTSQALWGHSEVRRRVAEGNWDHVVIQPHLIEPAEDRDGMFHTAAAIDAEVRRIGAQTLVFMTWVRDDQQDTLPAHIGAYRDLEERLSRLPENVAVGRRVRTVPVGVAWRNALNRLPASALYLPDHGHQTEAGAYLAACMFYAHFYGRSPEGLPAAPPHVDGRALVSVAPSVAPVLQSVAWQTTREWRGTATRPTTGR